MLRQLWTNIASRLKIVRARLSRSGLATSGRATSSSVTSRRRTSGRRTSGRLGAEGERLAARYLQQLGYRILARGHRQKLGEIDLIALDGSTLVFVEVKTWRRGEAGDPSEAVDARKQERLTRAALVYLKRRKLLEHPARFDVISIVWAGGDAKPEIRHFVNAFEAVGKWQMYR